MLLLLAFALGATTLLLHARATAPTCVRVGGAAEPEQTVSMRRGRSLLVLNADIRPHQVVQLAGPALDLDDARLERPGTGVRIWFDKRGEYTLQTVAGPCLVPRLEHDARRTHALLRVVVR